MSAPDYQESPLYQTIEALDDVAREMAALGELESELRTGASSRADYAYIENETEPIRHALWQRRAYALKGIGALSLTHEDVLDMVGLYRQDHLETPELEEAKDDRFETITGQVTGEIARHGLEQALYLTTREPNPTRLQIVAFGEDSRYPDKSKVWLNLTHRGTVVQPEDAVPEPEKVIGAYTAGNEAATYLASRRPNDGTEVREDKDGGLVVFIPAGRTSIENAFSTTLAIRDVAGEVALAAAGGPQSNIIETFRPVNTGDPSDPRVNPVPLTTPKRD